MENKNFDTSHNLDNDFLPSIEERLIEYRVRLLEAQKRGDDREVKYYMNLLDMYEKTPNFTFKEDSTTKRNI